MNLPVFPSRIMLRPSKRMLWKLPALRGESQGIASSAEKAAMVRTLESEKNYVKKVRGPSGLYWLFFGFFGMVAMSQAWHDDFSATVSTSMHAPSRPITGVAHMDRPQPSSFHSVSTDDRRIFTNLRG
eukprot:TRINITY_DN16715_c0_g1_i1.p1 TRINITY_DN16715_c0_g1~~TRINITY_DN16715_c0_g1_i1.p1  ORF type:complete len:128 (+),score=4.93 TRINITY_DN16715_c0_g1_i1:70-453(+)